MSAAREVLSELRLESGERWIDLAAPWQHEDAIAVLEGERGYSYITRPRGGSKTTDAAALSVCWLLTGPERARYYAAAADAAQARLLLDALDGFARRTPAIAGRLRVEASRVVAVESGATIEVMPADAASSWGIRPDGVVIDEAAWWSDTPQPRMLLDSLLSSAAKVEGCRVVVITSPSSPDHFAYRLRQHAASDPLWRLSEQTGPPPWLDPARVEEQRRRLPEAMYRRLFLGEWCEGEEQLAVSGDVEGCISHSGPLDPHPRHRYTIGADLGVRRDRTAVAICHREDERVIVDRLGLWKGSRLRPVQLGEVEEFIRQASKSYNGAELVADPWQAIQLMERLRGQGVKAQEFTFSQAGVGRLALTMVNLLRDQRLGLPDDDELLSELRAVRLIERSPGSFRIDHASGQHDDQVIAIALAAQHLLREPQYGKWTVLKDHPWSSTGSATQRRSDTPRKVWASVLGDLKPLRPVQNNNRR